MGRVLLLGDDIDTDQLAPGQHMRCGIEAIAAHCLEAVRPNFAASVRPGDVVVAGRNFGAGSSREQAAEALKHLGISGVVAQSFAGIFYRNAINLGLPALVVQTTGGIADGDDCVLDVDAAALKVGDSEIALEPIPANLRRLLEDGGLVPHLKKRFAENRR